MKLWTLAPATTPLSVVLSLLSGASCQDSVPVQPAGRIMLQTDV